MFYKFPVIETINDVLPAIKDSEEFKVYEKDDYTVINYVLQGNDTFPPLTSVVCDTVTRLRRECRGIIFDTSGRLIRRAYHKFFNMGEREETLDTAIDFTNEHLCLEKLDGSMVTPLPLYGRIRWATKAGITDISMQAEVFTVNNHNYQLLAEQFLRIKMLPIFEWCSPKNRIVIDHKEDSLILTAMRHQTTGEYMKYRDLKIIAETYNIPVVKAHSMPEYDFQFVEYSQTEKETEGIVLRFDNGHMLKIKTDWYVQIHRAKEKILHEKRVLDLILNEQLDDILSFLPEADKNKLLEYREKFMTGLKKVHTYIEEVWSRVSAVNMPRKEFALNIAPQMPPYMAAVIFSSWDDNSKLWESMLNIIKKNLGSQATVDRVRHLWDYTATWNYGAVNE